VLSPSGRVLSDNHLIEGATSIRVADVTNKNTYAADVLDYDRSAEVAVLRLIGASRLRVAKIGTSATLKVGSDVAAIGNAEGLDGTPSYAAGSALALNQSINAQDAITAGIK
jgi:S1-C subfamily serine protease